MWIRSVCISRQTFRTADVSSSRGWVTFSRGIPPQHYKATEVVKKKGD